MMIEAVCGLGDFTGDEEIEEVEKRFQNLPKVIFSHFEHSAREWKNVAHIQRPLDAGGSVTVGIDVSWGGSEGCETSAHVEAEVHDNDGNYVEGKVEQNSDGTGGAHVSAGHKDD